MLKAFGLYLGFDLDDEECQGCIFPFPPDRCLPPVLWADIQTNRRALWEHSELACPPHSLPPPNLVRLDGTSMVLGPFAQHKGSALRDASTDSCALRDAPRDSCTFQDAICESSSDGAKPGIYPIITQTCRFKMHLATLNPSGLSSGFFLFVIVSLRNQGLPFFYLGLFHF